MAGRIRGFTLIELILTLAVLAVLVGVAAPSFNNMLIANRMAGSVNQLHGLLKFARSEAVNRKTRITVCAANSGHTACNGTENDFSNGVLVMQGTSIVLMREDKLPATVSGTGKLVFDRNGVVLNARNLGLAKGSKNHCLKVTVAGQIRSENGSCP